MKIKISTLAVILLINLCLVKAQVWTHYTETNSGLTSNSVSKIIITPDNKKWIATLSGVSVFDGTNQWTTYTKANSGLIDNAVFDMAIDSLGNKWFATARGVSKFNGTTWTSYNTANSELQTDQVFSIAIDKKGIIYFGQSDNFISALNGNKWSFMRVVYGNMGYDVNELSVANSGNLYFSLRNEGLFLLAGGSIYTFDNLNFRLYDQKVSSILVDDANGKVWIGTEYALNLLTSTSMINYDFLDKGLTSVDISGIYIDGSNMKWLGTSEGLMKFDGIKFTIFSKKNSGIPDNWVGSIAQDKNGVFWLANAGLTKYNPTALGIQERLMENNLNVYPNPAINTVNIDCTSSINEITVSDYRGQVLVHINGNCNEINIETLNPGIYILQVNTENGSITKSLVKF